jgi:hypothetical protein
MERRDAPIGSLFLLAPGRQPVVRGTAGGGKVRLKSHTTGRNSIYVPFLTDLLSRFIHSILLNIK